jgi:hypothetical protein
VQSWPCRMARLVQGKPCTPFEFNLMTVTLARGNEGKFVGYAPRTIFKFSDELNPKRYTVRTLPGYSPAH